MCIDHCTTGSTSSALPFSVWRCRRCAATMRPRVNYDRNVYTRYRVCSVCSVYDVRAHALLRFSSRRAHTACEHVAAMSMTNAKDFPLAFAFALVCHYSFRILLPNLSSHAPSSVLTCACACMFSYLRWICVYFRLASHHIFCWVIMTSILYDEMTHGSFTEIIQTFTFNRKFLQKF